VVLFGACLGHGPADNSGHKRRLMYVGTVIYLGKWSVSAAPFGLVFSDTEAVMGAVPGHHCRDY
jgi:hypothetical protein